MADFESLCKKIIDTHGILREQDVLDCGYSKEHFIKLSQPSVKAEKLVKNARENLLARGLHYKEV